jgi:hypothetical protein
MIRAWASLALLASCASVAGPPIGQPETIYASKYDIEYSARTLSPDKTMLLFGEWKFGVKPRTLSQTIKIINLADGRVISQLSFSSKDRRTGAGLFDLGAASWDVRSATVFFTLHGKEGRLYEWDVRRRGYKETLGGLSSVARIVPSPDGKRIAFIEYDSDLSNRLKVRLTDTATTVELDSHVQYVFPMWKNEYAIVFAKENTIWEYDFRNDNRRKLAELTEGSVRYAEMRPGDQLYVVLDKDSDVAHNESGITRNSVREVWRCDLAAGKSEKLISFRTGSIGIAISDNSVIFSLSAEIYADSQLVSYDLSRNLLKQIPTRHVKNDLPLWLGSDKILYRGDNKLILSTRY